MRWLPSRNSGSVWQTDDRPAKTPCDAKTKLANPVFHKLKGLDGKYRLSSGGEAIRGYWADPQTFLMAVFDDGLITYQVHFDGDRVEIRSPELGLEFEGQIERP